MEVNSKYWLKVDPQQYFANKLPQSITSILNGTSMGKTKYKPQLERGLEGIGAILYAILKGIAVDTP